MCVCVQVVAQCYGMDVCTALCTEGLKLVHAQGTADFTLKIFSWLMKVNIPPAPLSRWPEKRASPPTSGFCVQCEYKILGFTLRSVNPAVVTGIYR